MKKNETVVAVPFYLPTCAISAFDFSNFYFSFLLFGIHNLKYDTSFSRDFRSCTKRHVVSLMVAGRPSVLTVLILLVMNEIETLDDPVYSE